MKKRVVISILACLVTSFIVSFPVQKQLSLIRPPVFVFISIILGGESGEGNGNPLQYSWLENPMDRGAWWATVHGVTKSRTLSDFTFTFMHWRRKWQPTPVFLPGESQGRGSVVGCRLWGRTGSDMTEVIQQHHKNLHFSIKIVNQI